MAMIEEKKKPHVAVFPSAGMGHLMPFLHFARTLTVSHDFSVTFITTHTNVSPIETAYLDSLAATGLDNRVVRLEVESQPQSQNTEQQDPFFAQWDATRKSMAAFENLLTTDLLQHSWRRPISAIITDPSLTPTLDITTRYKIPNYVLFTASALTFGFMVHAPVLESRGFDFGDENAIVQVSGFPTIPTTQIPQAVKIKDNLFRKVFLSSGSNIAKASGVFLNTFEALEEECLQALWNGQVATDLPPLYAVGPMGFQLTETANLSVMASVEREENLLKWLDTQPVGSVVYVSFGSRSAMSEVQICQLAEGLESSGQRFLWVLRTSVVDDGSSDMSVLPPGFESRVKGRGMVISSWVPQKKILCHASTGAFVSHCGWNSVIESICCGVPIVAWPLFGDQMFNARILEEICNVGLKVRVGKDGIVSKDEVERAVRRIMEEEEWRRAALKMKELGRMAIREGGSSDKSMREAIEKIKRVDRQIQERP